MRFTPASLLLSLAFAACTPGGEDAQPAALHVRDLSGRNVDLPAPAGRVVALIPAATEIVIRLGAGDRLVARTDYDQEPELRHLPSVGGGLTPSLEWLVARRPDLVVAWPDERARDVVSRLDAAGIAVYAARMETLEDIRRTARDLGTLLGLRPRADTLVVGMDALLDSVGRSVAGREHPRVLYLESRDPPLVVGSGTYLNELIGIAGGENVFSDATTPWPHVSLEEIVRRRPEVLLLPVTDTAAADTAWLRRAPVWRELPAVRNGRVHPLDENTFSRPGLGVGRLAVRLAELLHMAPGTGP